MLFNTLAYAKFFGVVFVASWALVDRRATVLLPWLGLALWVAGTPSAMGVGIAGAALVLSVALARRVERGGGPTLTEAAASVLVNFTALGWLTWRHDLGDPLGHALRSLGVPLGTSPVLTAVLAIAAPVALVGLVRARRVRLVFILGASYVFYAAWDWRFLGLIIGSSTVDWLLGNAIAREAHARRRKLWLLGTVLVNLGVLGVFKYFNFGVDTARALLTSLGFDAPEVALRIGLPVGISFFTFESMSYVIDVYRREIEPHPSYVEYLSFVAFFPHLVAGPIVRPRDLLPQLAGPPRFSARVGSEGLFLIAVGLLKKVVIGDYLALNLIDRVFDAPAQYSALECYAAVVSYAVQIYADFSGYTDVAIGSALLLGVRFPLNFDAPYKAADIQDFWRRWHISLSTWLRDYLYVPLGGNRRGPARTYVNLLLTMLLGGLWHGASWSFVVWGGLHGAALAVTRAWQRRPSATPNVGVVRRVAGVWLTFHFVCATWIFFRADSFTAAHAIFERLATGTTYHPNLSRAVVGCLALGLISHWAPERLFTRLREGFCALPAPAQGGVLFGVALVLREVATADAVPFVYFQF